MFLRNPVGSLSPFSLNWPHGGGVYEWYIRTWLFLPLALSGSDGRKFIHCLPVDSLGATRSVRYLVSRFETLSFMTLRGESVGV